MFENPRKGRQARNFTTNVSKILALKSSSEQMFFRKLSLGAPGVFCQSKPTAFLPFSLPSQSSLHKLPLFVINVLKVLIWGYTNEF